MNKDFSLKKITEFFIKYPSRTWGLLGLVFFFIQPTLGALFLLVWLVFFIKNKRWTKQEKVRVMTEETARFVALTSDMQKMPITSCSILLQKDEQAILEEEVVLKETKTIRRSTGSGAGIRVMKGVTVGGFGSRTESFKEWHELEKGILTLTSQRLVFTGMKENRSILLKDILDIDGYFNALMVASNRKTSIFTPENPSKWAIAVKILRKVNNPFALNLEEIIFVRSLL